MPVEENELSYLLLCASLLSRLLLLQILDALANLPPLLSIYMCLQPCEMSTHSICSSAYQPSFLGGVLALGSKPKTSNCPEGGKKMLAEYQLSSLSFPFLFTPGFSPLNPGCLRRIPMPSIRGLLLFLLFVLSLTFHLFLSE